MKRAFYLFLDSVRLFRTSGAFDRAAAISFYAFFSLIPIMFLITASLGFIIGTHGGLEDRVIGMVMKSLPYISERMIFDLKGLSSDWKAYGWLGFISLISSAELVLDATARALMKIFGVNRGYGFIRKRIIYLFILFFGVLAALFSIAITAIARIFEGIKLEVLGLDISYYLIQSLTFRYILPFSVVVLIVSAIYKIFSGPTLNFRYALYGGMLFGVLWEAAKHLFAWYVSNFPSYNKFYGSLGTLMILLIWIYYSASILLFSASFAVTGFNKRESLADKEGKGRKTSRKS